MQKSFVIDRWLDIGEGDGKINLDLQPSVASSSPTKEINQDRV